MFTTIFKEHKYRIKQIFILAKTDLIKTYKGSLLGPYWSVVKPLFTLFVFWFAFQIGIRNGRPIEVNGMNFEFFHFMLPGFIAWFFMQDCILGGSRCIRKNSQFVQKMSFPVSTITTFSTLSNFFVHLGITALMYIFILVNMFLPHIAHDHIVKGCSLCTDGIVAWGPNIYNVQFFFYAPLMFLFFWMLSWSTATMSAFSKDFGNLIHSVMTGFFWLSGIIWNSYSLQVPKIIRTIMLFNPINYFVNGYRKAFLYQEWFWQRPEETIIFFAEFLIIFIIGCYNYNRLRKTLPDVL